MLYLDIRGTKVLSVRVLTSTEDNKNNPPKTIITDDGLVDSLEKPSNVFIDKIIYRSYQDTVRLNRLDDELSKLNDDESVFVVNIEGKALISRLELNQKHKRFRKFTGIGTSFINSLMSELSEIDVADIDTELNLIDYLKAKIDVHTYMSMMTNLFFYKDMPKGYYYAYHNKEKSGDDSDSIDVQKTKIVLGKKTSANCYQVMKIPEQVELDTLYADWRKTNDYDLYCIMLLNRVTNSKNIYYRNNGNLKHKESPSRLESPTGDIMVSEIMPAGISYFAFKEFKRLQTILDDFIEHDCKPPRLTIYELTDNIFVNVPKNPKKPELGDTLDIKFPSNFTINHPLEIAGTKFIIPVISSLDIPHRNTLKKLVKDNPRVYLVVENDSDVYCYHYTIVTSDIGSIITGNLPANLTLLQNNKKNN